VISIMFEYGWMVLIVIAGAAVNMLKQFVESKRDPELTITILESVYHMLGAIFAGATVALISSQWIESVAVIGGISGFSSYLGIRGLEQAFDLVVDFVESKIKSDEKPQRKRPNRGGYYGDDRTIEDDEEDENFKGR